MRESRRAKRMALHHKRSAKRNAVLNMVSLMDIFTILAAEKLPSRTLVIAVDGRVIRLQGMAIITVKDALDSKQKTIRPLFEALRAAADSVKGITDKKGVTIMGDQEISYGLLKKIMLTCAGAQYTNISFAVNQKAPDG